MKEPLIAAIRTELRHRLERLSSAAREVEEMAAAVRAFESLRLPDFGIDEPIDAGALVEAELDGETSWFLLAPAAGGLVVRHEEREITLLTPDSELYRKLLGRRVGD